MKVSPSATKEFGKSPDPILPLRWNPDEHQAPKEKSRTFELRTNPTDANSPKYKIVARVLDGTEHLRTCIQWILDLEKIHKGLNVNNAIAKVALTKELLQDTALTVYVNYLEAYAKELREKAADVAYDAELDAMQKQSVKDGIMATDLYDATAAWINQDAIEYAIMELTRSYCPLKVFSKVKRYLRKVRKPADMSVREYWNLLTRINCTEIPMLPPFTGSIQSLEPDEFIEIICQGVPKSWLREMDRQGKDPDLMNENEVLKFFEQIECAEEHDANAKKIDKAKKSKDNGKKRSHGHGNGNGEKGKKYCALHGVNASHNTDNCTTLAKQAKKFKQSKDGNQSGSHNKTWKRSDKKDQDKSKTYSKKEVNAIVKSALEHATKELNALSKQDDDKNNDEASVDSSKNSSVASDFEVNNVEKELFDMNIEDVTDEISL
jgi:hypothetical protein